MRRLRSLLIGAASALLAAAPLPAAQPAPRLDAARILAARFGNDAAWYADRIPLFESSDATLDAVYYYRWSLFRAHQRDLGALGFISTEFLDDVGWQREPYASLNDASGFHLYEGRWLRDRRHADDYLRSLTLEGGNDRHFSEAIADAAWARYLVDHDREAAVALLPVLRHVYGLWDDHFDFSKGLYWIEPLLDATEYSVASIDASGGTDGFTGGHAFRPSINSYMAANARAISRLAALAGDTATAAEFAGRAERLRLAMLTSLWSKRLGHFVDRYRITNDHVRYWEPIRARELVGFLPWSFGLLDGDRRFDAAWSRLRAPDGFGGAAGLRTVEPGYAYYMRQYRYDRESGGRECQWNGPVWPFQTTQALMGLERLLHHSHAAPVGRAGYVGLLRQYARLHYQGDRLDLEEDYDPETGRPIVGLARSHHYFHSGFIDLVMTGLAGIEPSAGDDVAVDPLLAAKDRGGGCIRYFALQDVPYHGRLLSIVYDEDGSRYGVGAGLRVYVDGILAGSLPMLGRLVVSVPARPNPAIERPVDQAVGLVRSAYPRASASSGTDPERLHDAIDGRIWFFPEAPNGWESAGQGEEEWFSVDFGRTVTLRAAELAFFADARLSAPRRFRIQYRSSTGWRDIPGAAGVSPRANGSVPVAWPPIGTRSLRVLFEKEPGRQMRLVELKAF